MLFPWERNVFIGGTLIEDMFWRKQQRVERQLTQIHNTLQQSFSNVKNDTQTIFSWLQYLYQQNNSQQQVIQQQQYAIQQLQQDVEAIPTTPAEIKRVIDSYYSFDTLQERIRQLQERIDMIARAPQPQINTELPAATPAPSHVRALEELQERLDALEAQRKATVREKVVQRVAKNSKEYVKSLIMSYIRKYGQIPALQLKEMVVEDQGLCSKSSFYRILEELEKHHEVGTARKGKQKFYIYKLARRT